MNAALQNRAFSLNRLDQVELVNQILHAAIQKGASDIHFEPSVHQYRIRFRLDGLLYEHLSLPLEMAERITARLKILANLDTAEKRLPQDGRITQGFESINLDLRIATCPTLYGEKIALRILDKTRQNLAIETLGMEDAIAERLKKTLEKPQGLILVTGPTGSGKTLTLYSALNFINHPARHILTAEDPVEIHMDGINQVNTNPKAGLNFAAILRAFLRQDPDVLMVGEIRDQETAEMAIKAALTGHLVLSTLHTNSAAATLTRLLDLKIPAFNIISSLRLVIAQRLVRTLCDFCKKAEGAYWKPSGCNNCYQGFKGRTGLFECLSLPQASLNPPPGQNSYEDIFSKVRLEGKLTLYEAGLLKVKRGITTLDEVNRVVMD